LQTFGINVDRIATCPRPHSKMMLLLVLSLSLFSVYPLSIPSAIKAIKRPLTKTYDTLTNKPRTPEELKLGIAAFYDKSSELWEDVWGEHLHHGYYDPPDRTDHVQAQVDMVDKLLDFADINSADVINAIDVGCGLGGSTRHIANRFPNCKQTTGITLSPFQEKRGNELCVNSKIADRAKVMVADALSMPFPDDSFDLVWSLESGEHMPDKKKFVSELLRVANKKGTGESKIIICTWVTRDLKDNETRLRQSERRLLRRINRSYYLPEVSAVSEATRFVWLAAWRVFYSVWRKDAPGRTSRRVQI